MGKSHLFFYVRHEDILFNLDMRILGLPYVGRQSHLGDNMERGWHWWLIFLS